MHMGVEKYIGNIVGDVVSSQGVVVMNGINILWSDMDIITWCACYRIGWKNISRKMENVKVIGTGLLNTPKDTRES